MILGAESSKRHAGSVTSNSVIPLEEAQSRILATVPRLPAATIPLAEALGLVTVEALAATEPIPPFANTGVDGYAVQAADTAGATPESPVRLRIVDELPAGKAPTVPVGPGEAIRIMTGAPIPDGADAIVMVEDTSAEDGDGGFVVIRKEARPGDHIRRAGGDLDVGDPAIPAGTCSARPTSGSWPASATPPSSWCAGPGWRSCRPATSWSRRASRWPSARSATPTGRCSWPWWPRPAARSSTSASASTTRR